MPLPPLRISPFNIRNLHYYDKPKERGSAAQSRETAYHKRAGVGKLTGGGIHVADHPVTDFGVVAVQGGPLSIVAPVASL